MGILLVSERKIKAFTEVNENVDSQLLLANIQIAQDLGLQGVLGTKFMNHIMNAAQNNTLTAAENTLLQDYIQPYLLWRATWEALPAFFMRIMNKSIIVGNTEQGAPIDKSQLSYLRNIYQSRYEFYAQRLMDYIKNNQSDYPIYYQYTSTDGMSPSRENYFSGIHIEPGARKLPPYNRGGKKYGLPTYTSPTGDYCCYDDSF